MADATKIVMGERTNADVALDLMQWVFSYMDDKPQTRDDLLELYLRCRQATVRSTADFK
jgi:hypothetical protein